MYLMNKILEIPWVYNFVQFIFAASDLKPFMGEVLKEYKDKNVLELGAGTGAFTPQGFSSLTVTDINQSYLDQIQVSCQKIVTSATVLPFADESFDMIFSAGLFHHLSDQEYIQSMKEIRRALRQNGVFINLDNIPPTRFYRVIAFLIRKMDRGRFVRKSSQQIKIIEKELFIETKEIGSYAWCGLEYILFKCKKI